MKSEVGELWVVDLSNIENELVVVVSISNEWYTFVEPDIIFISHLLQQILRCFHVENGR